MTDTYWQQQTKDKPLFPDLLWSRPENRASAGKLLIVGGNKFGFAAPAEAYQEAVKAGIGTARVLLPDAIKPIAGRILEHGDYAPSTPSGSLGQKALADLLEHSAWADAVVLAGDLGRNSETLVVIEKFLSKYPGQVTLTKEAIDYYISNPLLILSRKNTTMVLTMAQLQKMATKARHDVAFTFAMPLTQLVAALHTFSLKFPCQIVLKHLDQLVVSINGRISTTPTDNLETWRVKTAAHASVWWLQNPTMPFEAITSALCTPQNTH